MHDSRVNLVQYHSTLLCVIPKILGMCTKVGGVLYRSVGTYGRKVTFGVVVAHTFISMLTNGNILYCLPSTASCSMGTFTRQCSKEQAIPYAETGNGTHRNSTFTQIINRDICYI